MDTRNKSADSTNSATLEPWWLEMAQQSNKSIDPDLVPLLIDGAWYLDGMVYESKSDRKMMGNVNIGNRIFTDATVTFLGEGKYKISSKNDFYGASSSRPSFSLNPNQSIEATVDGIAYKGKEIIVDKKEVYVDGVHMIPKSKIPLHQP